jgi:hypothetical protein
MLLLLIGVFIGCVYAGSQILSPFTVIKGILGKSDSLRLPRAYVAILSGAA